MNTNLTVLTFDSPTGAAAMLEDLKQLQADNFIELLDAVIVTKDSNGRVEIRQPLEVGPGKGAAFGALTGAIVGLLGGPGGALVGLVSGAITGGATAAAMEAGLPQADIKTMAVDELGVGESALVVYVDDVWIDQIEDAAKAVAANVANHIVREQRTIEREKAAELRKEKVDASYKAWQTKVDHARTSVDGLRQQATSSLQADQAAVQSRLDHANAQLQTIYKHMIQTLGAWKQQVDARIAELEAQAKQATTETKADIQKRLTTAKETRSSVRAHAKDTLAARLNATKANVDHLKAQAAKAQGQAKDQVNQRIAKLQADWDAEDKQLDELDKAEGAAWDAMVKSIDESIDSFETSLAEAETEYEKQA